MFWLNRGYKWGFDNIQPRNIIFLPSGLTSFDLLHRKIPSESRILLDPQLYFPINTDANFLSERKKTYLNLASYPWFSDEPARFNSKEIKLSDFKKKYKENLDIFNNLSIPSDREAIKIRLRACFDFQKNFGTTYLIIPTPLVSNYEDEFSIQLEWINSAVELSSEYHLPMLATIALSEDVILNQDFSENRVLQTIIDNLSVIDELTGFYLVVERSNSENCIKNSNLSLALLEMSYYLGHLLSKEFIIK